VIIPKALLQQVLDSGNPHIRVAVERFVAHLIRRNPLDLVQQIEELIARQLANGDCSLAGIAQQLAMNERTLQRRLEAQQIRFSDILDRVRRSQAHEFLAQAALPLAEVAFSSVTANSDLSAGLSALVRHDTGSVTFGVLI